MVIMFFLALIFAWPTSGLSILAYIVLLFAWAFLKAKMRMYHADKQHALREIGAGGGKFPSWARDKDEVEVFICGVQKTGRRNGLSESFMEASLSNPLIVNSLFKYAGAMEAQGASFIEQQLAFMERLIDMQGGYVTDYPYSSNDHEQIEKLRYWLEHETSWGSTSHLSDEQLLKTRKLVLGDAVSGELRYPKVRYIPHEIMLMKELEDLHLQLNNLDRLPPTICSIASLKKLRLGGNGLTTLPERIGKLKNLELLTLWSNDLSELPQEIGELINLKALNIAHNQQLTRLPDSIVSLKKLQAFDWYGQEENVLTERQLLWLQELQASGCQLNIPDSLENLLCNPV